MVPALLYLLSASPSAYMTINILHDTNKVGVVDYLRKFSINHLKTTYSSHISEAYSYNKEAHTAIDFY